MELRKYRFKKELFTIDGIFNITGFVIASGHGYDFKTYCCKNCGEIFVAQLESFQIENIETNNKNDNYCPKCNVRLKENLVEYPENIFYENRILKNDNHINRIHYENTEILEAYLLI
jgi:DNA-directed RNA polymerase subunit RPC12/RpoP